MPSGVGPNHSTALMIRTACVAFVLAAGLAGCREEQAADAAPQIRPVRTATIEKREGAGALTFSGRIEAEDEVTLAFRISGRIIELDAKVGDRVEAGQTLARLESQ